MLNKNWDKDFDERDLFDWKMVMDTPYQNPPVESKLTKLYGAVGPKTLKMRLG